MNSWFVRLRYTAVALLLMPGSAMAQGEFVTVDFQGAPPYRAVGPTGQSQVLEVLNNPGPKAANVLWNHTAMTNGWNGRGFARYNWWDWDVSRTGHGSEPAGWTAGMGSFRPASGWPGNGPYYARFRMRVNAPLIPYSGGSCDDTQMKFLIWNAFTPEGTDRVIGMLHSGSESGGSNQNETSIQLRAGVSGSSAMARFPNYQWVHVQLAWRWGQEGTAYQRIYINNNSVGSPNVQNLQFDDLDMHGVADSWGPPAGPPRGLDSQFFLGDIANTGSCVSEDAALDIMDFEMATAFDQSWFPGGSTSPSPAAPTNVHIVRTQAALFSLPFVTLGLVVSLKRRKEPVD